MGRTKKVTTAAKASAKAVREISKFNLGAIRASFDGLKDLLEEIPEGKVRSNLMTQIEETYLSVATGIRHLGGAVVSAAQ